MRVLPFLIVLGAVIVASIATIIERSARDEHLGALRDSVASNEAGTVRARIVQVRSTLVEQAQVLSTQDALRAGVMTDAKTVQDQIAHEALKNLDKHRIYAIGRRGNGPEMPDEVLASAGLTGLADAAIVGMPAVQAVLKGTVTDAVPGTVIRDERLLLFAIAPVVSYGAPETATHGFVLVGDVIDQKFLETLGEDVHAVLALSDGHRVVAGYGATATLQRLLGAVGTEQSLGERTYTDPDWQVAARAVPIDPSQNLFLWVGADISGQAAALVKSFDIAVGAIWIGLLGGGIIVALVLARRGRPAVPAPLEAWAGSTGTTGAQRTGMTGTLPASGPPLLTTPAPAEGGMFGRYRLLERLGSGGMAEVWTAVVTGAEGFRRPVVIKRIRRDLASNQALIQPFIDEANLAAQLVHSNIVPVFDFGHLNDEYFLAQEYILGRDVAKITAALAERGERLDPGLALYICAETLKALDYAHTLTERGGRPLGIVHRDISPTNILCSLRGEVKLIDFGIAKSVSKVGQTEVGTVKGNLRFMSPEQAQGQSVDGRSDIFSLGMALYFTQTGESLYTGTTQYDLIFAAAHGPDASGLAKVGSLPSPLREFLLRALATSVDTRFPSAQAFLEALQPYVPVDGGRRLAALLNDLFGPDLRQQEAQFAGAFGGSSDPGVSDIETVQSLSPRIRQGLT